MVFAAHPDDEVLGCGATLMKLIDQGFEVKCIFFTDGVSAREKKKKHADFRKKCALKVSKNIKARTPIFYEFPDNNLSTVPRLKIIKIIEQELDKFLPSKIFTHFHNDLNLDHRVICNAVMTACRPFAYPQIEEILHFEILSSTECQIPKKEIFNPNCFFDITKYIKKKQKLLNIYSKELRSWPHPRSSKGVKVLSEYRGMMSGFKDAESFMISRKKIK